jgi:hypothetical protein
MANIDQAEANRMLAASLTFTTFALGTSPMKVALTTTSPTSSTNGTEVSGGSYARTSVTFSAPANGSGGTAGLGTTANTNAVSFTNMPAATTTSLNIFDSNATPRRAWYGDLTASKTTALGDTLSFAIGAIAVSLG